MIIYIDGEPVSMCADALAYVFESLTNNSTHLSVSHKSSRRINKRMHKQGKAGLSFTQKHYSIKEA